MYIFTSKSESVAMGLGFLPDCGTKYILLNDTSTYYIQKSNQIDQNENLISQTIKFWMFRIALLLLLFGNFMKQGNVWEIFEISHDVFQKFKIMYENIIS